MRTICFLLLIFVFSGCKVEVFQSHPVNTWNINEYFVEGIIIDEFGDQYPQILNTLYGRNWFQIADGTFHREFTWSKKAGTNTEFWFWMPGSRNFCGGSTNKTCIIDSSWFAEVPSDNVIFDEKLEFSLVAVERPAKCTPPDVLYDLIASEISGDYGQGQSPDIRLCEGQVYEDIRGRFDEPFYANRIYADPGVTIRNSNLRGALIVFNNGNRVTLDSTTIETAKGNDSVSIIKGLNIKNGSVVNVGLVNIRVEASIAFEDISVSDTSAFGIYTGYYRKHEEINAGAFTISVKNLRTSNTVRPGYIGISGSNTRVVIRDSTLKTAGLRIEASNWYGDDINIDYDSVEIAAGWCDITPSFFGNFQNCTTQMIREYLESIE